MMTEWKVITTVSCCVGKDREGGGGAEHTVTIPLDFGMALQNISCFSQINGFPRTAVNSTVSTCNSVLPNHTLRHT
jgi:hypothetical protein